MRNYIAGMLLAALLIAIALSGRMPVNAAPSAYKPDVECVPWATASGWSTERCYDWGSGDVCIISTSGMQSCKFGD